MACCDVMNLIKFVCSHHNLRDFYISVQIVGAENGTDYRLVQVIGRKNRVYEILSRKRPLSLRMIQGLHANFSIPAESLIKPSSVV